MTTQFTRATRLFNKPYFTREHVERDAEQARTAGAAHVEITEEDDQWVRVAYYRVPGT